MHVRIAWEIYHHQQKTPVDGSKVAPSLTPGTIKSELLRPPSHLFPPTASPANGPPPPPSVAGLVRPHDLPSVTYPGRSPFDQGPPTLSGAYLGAPTSHLGNILVICYNIIILL